MTQRSFGNAAAGVVVRDQPTMLRSVELIIALLLLISPGTAARAEDAWWGRDKALHFSVSAGLALGTYGAARALDVSPAGRLALSASTAFGIGILKELADAAGYGDPSLRDLSWDLLGTATGVLIAWTLDRLLSSPPEPRAATARLREPVGQCLEPQGSSLLPSSGRVW